MDKKLSVVIPCYNAQNNIEKVVESAEEIFAENEIANYEFVLVNDCSQDSTRQVITDLAEKQDNIIAIDLAKNCGQQGALMAGFHYVSGDYVVTCEDDGQTQISKIGEMLNKIEEGYDAVVAKYTKRHRKSLFRSMGTWFAHRMSMAMIPRPEGIQMSVFFLARRFVIDEMIKYQHAYPYVSGLLLRTTHNIANVEVEQLERMSGESGYNFRKLFGLWMNGYTTFSVRPLRIATVIGMLSALCGIIYAIVIVVRKLAFGNVITGWASTMCVMLVLFGVVLLVLGLIGEYIGRIYLCINSTPQYIVRSVTGEQFNKTNQEKKEETNE